MDSRRLELDRIWAAIREESRTRERDMEELRGLIAGPAVAHPVEGPSFVPEAPVGEQGAGLPSGTGDVMWAPPPSDIDLVDWQRPPSPTDVILAEAAAGTAGAVDGIDVLQEILGGEDLTEMVAVAGIVAEEGSDDIPEVDLSDNVLGPGPSGGAPGAGPADGAPGTGPTDDALVVAPSGGMPGVGPAGPAVLLIGDSMLRRAGFRCDPPRRLSTLAVPGYTLSRWVRTGSTEVRRWLGRVGEGRPDVILWLGGNDVYPRGPSYCPSTVVRTLHRLQEIIVDLQGLGCTVTLLGTTPRPVRDRHRTWEQTPAYWLERALRDLDRSTGAQFVPLGRRLCKRSGTGRNRTHWPSEMYFEHDGVHLNNVGYHQLLPALPGWIRWEA